MSKAKAIAARQEFLALTLLASAALFVGSKAQAAPIDCNALSGPWTLTERSLDTNRFKNDVAEIFKAEQKVIDINNVTTLPDGGCGVAQIETDDKGLNKILFAAQTTATGALIATHGCTGGFIIRAATKRLPAINRLTIRCLGEHDASISVGER